MAEDTDISWGIAKTIELVLEQIHDADPGKPKPFGKIPPRGRRKQYIEIRVIGDAYVWRSTEMRRKAS